MGWIDSFSKAWGWGVDTTLNVVGSAFSVSGRILSAAGGMGIVVGQELYKTLNLVYYGDVVAVGGLAVDGLVDGSELGLNYTLPLQVSGNRTGQFSSELTKYQYLDPNLFYLVSTACIGSGMLLSTFGDSIKKWQQYRYDARYLKQHYGVELVRPSGKEMLVSIGQSCCASLTISMLSHSIISCIAQYSKLFDVLYLTYPFSSDKHANGTYYHGPLARGSYPIAFDLDPQTIFVELPFLGNVSLTLEMALRAIANTTYGGGVFLKENGTQDAVVVTPAVTEVISATLGSGSYFALKFFDRTAILMRDNRIQASRASSYMTIQNDSMRMFNNT